MPLLASAATAMATVGSIVLPYAIPARGEKVVLTSFHGRGYRGNPRVLFEAMIGTRTLDPVWLSIDPAVVDRVRSRFGEHRAEIAGSWAGNLALAAARVIVLSHGTTDLPGLHLGRRAVVLQAWHGLPTKTGELWDGGLDLRARLVLRARWQAVDFMLSSSPLVSEIYRARFGLRRRQMLELGYPDHDRLCRRSGALDSREAFAEAPAHDRVVLYAPTFRVREPTRLLPFPDLDVPALERFLAESRAILVVRPHPNDRIDAERLCARSSRFVLADDRRIEDVVPLVLCADVIVTDYSGIFLDGLLSDTPCVFVPYDRGEYERGIPWEYDQHTPGPKVARQAEFIAACRRGLEQPEADAPWRARVRAQFFKQTDGDATARVLSWLENIVGVRRPREP